ncbi:MAG TPA: DUF433 domain-containing protein [Candidatus Nanoarchaeia archaeon]
MAKVKSLPKKDLVPGSKIPITYLLDYVKEGYSVTDFVSAYPWVKRSDVEKALEEIKKRDFTSQYAV